MQLKNLIQSLSDKVQASVKSVYGEPIITQEKTIIPIAEVKYGFGAGGIFIQKPPYDLDHATESAASGESGGAGGGVQVTPKGIIEITPDKTTYLPLNRWDWRGILAFMSLGAIVSLVILKALKKK